jgi:membrane-associated protease RseP (regulator of RpoE activity)
METPTPPPAPDPLVPPPPLPPRTDPTAGRRWKPRWFRWRFRYAEHPLFHFVLFLTTFLTMTAAGSLFFSGAATFVAGIPRGLRFSIPAMIILGTHEMGHYLMCRRYGLAATLPYFLPAPTIFGTLGAVIRIKEPIRNKAMLLDIGAAGPLVGFVMALPFLFYGVTHAVPIPTPPTPDTDVFGYPLAVVFAQRWTGMAAYTSATVHEDPTFMAAWLGLIVTALNLLPIGQLDGGHVLRAAIGKRQPIVSLGVLLLALSAALRGGYAWAFFAAVVAALIGVAHPPVEDDEVPIGTGRLTVALVCLAVFLLCFTLVPFGPIGDAARS